MSSNLAASLWMEVGRLFQNFMRYVSNGKRDIRDIVSFSEGTSKNLQNLSNGTQPSHYFLWHIHIHTWQQLIPLNFELLAKMKQTQNNFCLHDIIVVTAEVSVKRLTATDWSSCLTSPVFRITVSSAQIVWSSYFSTKIHVFTVVLFLFENWIYICSI